MVHAFREDELTVDEDSDVGKACAEDDSFSLEEDLAVDKELVLDKDCDVCKACADDESFPMEEDLAVDKDLALDEDGDAAIDCVGDESFSHRQGLRSRQRQQHRRMHLDNADFCSQGDC